MANLIHDPDIDVGKKRPSRLLIGCGIGILLTICVVSFVLIGGFAGFLAIFGGEPEGLEVSITMPPPQLSVGNLFEVSVGLSNVSTRNITITEIQLPNNLLDKTLLISVDPSSARGTEYGDQTGFSFDLTIAPNGQETVLFSFEALEPGDASGDIDVVAGTKSVTTSVRLAFSEVTSVDVGEGEDEDLPVTEEPTLEPQLGEIIPYRSVVQIFALVEMDNQIVEGWTGSGTVISEDGLILTNAHVVLSDRFYDVVDLVVAITTAQDQPPVQMFFADVLQADAFLDLAVIQVRSDLNGGPADFASLNIDPVSIGSSEDLQLGDEIIIIGYPGIGGETITLTRGEVSGFTSQEPFGNRAYIKTSATIAGGNSGGLAATAQGQIIGVPTQVGSGDIEVEFVDCRRLVDTNRDGVIDEDDNCVPTGGFINALRPIRLALPLIDAAKAGEVAIEEDRGGEQHEEYEPEGGNLIIGDDFTDNRNEWGLLDDSEGLVEISDGRLTITVFQEQYYVWTTLIGSYDNLILAAEAEVVNPQGDGDFGFVCGVQDGSNFTAMEITEDGYYSIWKMVNGQSEMLVDWTYSELVASGGPYSMAAYCGDDRLAFAVNEMLLTEISDPDYVSGAVGLIAGTYENPNFSVGFDYYYIYEP